jgi:DNA-binding transcriptional LysR family regulator
LAERPGLWVTLTLGDVLLYDLRALGLDGVVRLLPGAPRVEPMVWLLLTPGLAAALAPRPDWAGAERLGDAAADRLERPGDAAADRLLCAPL